MRRTILMMSVLALAACGSTDAASGDGDDSEPTHDSSHDGPIEIVDEVSEPDITVEKFATCADDDAPSRCGVDPREHHWGRAAVLTDLWLDGTPDEEVCCVDANGDGRLENSLGVNLAGFGVKSELNDDVAVRLHSGEDAVVLEFGAARNGTYDKAHWWRANWGSAMESLEPDGPNVLRVTDVDHGVQSNSVVGELEADKEKLVVRSGRVVVPTMSLTVPLNLPAYLVEMRLAPIDGTRLEERRLRGHLTVAFEVDDYYRGINDVAVDCDCLGTDEPLIDPVFGSCRTLPAGSCAAADDEVCAELTDYCSVLTFAALFADLDVDGDGLADAISAAYEVSFAPAEIVGIGPGPATGAPAARAITTQ